MHGGGRTSARSRWHPRTLVDGLRARPFALDVLLAVVVVAVSLALTRAMADEMARHPDTYRATHPVDALTYALVVLANLPVAWRRRRPVAALVAMMVVAVPFVVARFADTGVSFGPLVLVYSLAAHTDRATARRWGAVFAAVLGGLLAQALVRSPELSRWAVVSNVVVFGTAFLLGDNMRNRRALAQELRARAERAEAQRESEARRAVLDERTRIARELHDIVAHSVSVMVVQAAAARRVLDKGDADRASASLAAIESTGRESLQELRRILGVLRTERAAVPGAAGDDGPALTPQPGLAELASLLEHCREAGVAVELDVEGDARALPAAVELTAFRIVQESLTNVLKHAGPARARVRLAYDADTLRVDVVDDGRGAAADRSSDGGHGLQGMRERVDAFGGTLRAGPCVGGGFAVRASLPVGAAS